MTTKIKVMKTCNWSGIIFLMLNFFWLVSCDKNDNTGLVDSSYKTLEVSFGDDFEIPVLTNNWSIESVHDISSGKYLIDKDGNLLALHGNGKAEASNGWLMLTRDKEDKFTIGLKENFDKDNERKFVICINDTGQRDYITVIQQAGPGYKLIGTVFTEIENQRQIYESEEGCTSVVLSNYTSEAVWTPYENIFKNVVELSHFESDDYGAFDWVPEEGVEISVPELLIDNSVWWSDICIYKKGIITTPYYLSAESKLLVQPYSKIAIKGEITYCKRIYNYTLTVQNIRTGSLSEINGIWTQIIPISPKTILYSNEPI